jgi:hypothetical protein
MLSSNNRSSSTYPMAPESMLSALINGPLNHPHVTDIISDPKSNCGSSDTYYTPDCKTISIPLLWYSPFEKS